MVKDDRNAITIRHDQQLAHTPPFASMSHAGAAPLLDYSNTQYDEHGNKIPRAPNAWILYRKDRVNDFRKENPGKTPTQKDLSKWIGAKWQSEVDSVRDYYNGLAERAAQEHARRYPGYKYKPEKKADKVIRMATEKEQKQIAKAKAKEVEGGVKRAGRRRVPDRHVSPSPASDSLSPQAHPTTSLPPQLLPPNFSLTGPEPGPSRLAATPAAAAVPRGLPFIPEPQLASNALPFVPFPVFFSIPQLELSGSYANFGFPTLPYVPVGDQQFVPTAGPELFVPQAQFMLGVDGVYHLTGDFSPNEVAVLGAPTPGSIDLFLGDSTDHFFQPPPDDLPLTDDQTFDVSGLLANFAPVPTLDPRQADSPESDDTSSLRSPATDVAISQPLPQSLTSPTSPASPATLVNPPSPPSPQPVTAEPTTVQAAPTQQATGAFRYRKRRAGPAWA